MTNKERDELITYPLIKLNEMLDDYPESESPERTAIVMGIRALEKEKERALQEAKTSSNNNNSISNDNTRLKICQEIIGRNIEQLVIHHAQLSDAEKRQYVDLCFVEQVLKEIINETKKDL